MKKSVVCVIAHPDDEAFGPSGTIAKLSRTYDAHIVCVTDGQSDPRFHASPGESLAQLRDAELRKSAKILGAKEVHFFHFQDGTLNNNQYHVVAEKLIAVCNMVKPSLIITNELRGVSGHLDHVAVGLISSFVYTKLLFIDAILYNCTTREVSEAMQEYFVFFPPGFKKEDVDLVIDVSEQLDQKIAAAQCHESQAADVARVTARWKTQHVQEEWFFVTKRKEFTL